ncbi:MAG: hypothetical protein NTV46_02850, partial [Verrucomicrobia bacterium]|nr:hypothetical protein [Verrucomicrobiota bacterium]
MQDPALRPRSRGSVTPGWQPGLQLETQDAATPDRQMALLAAPSSVASAALLFYIATHGTPESAILKISE